MRAQTLFLLSTVTLVGCTIRDYGSDYSYGSASASGGSTTSGWEDQVGSFPGNMTLGIAGDGTNVYVATQDSQTGEGSIVRLDGSTLGLTLAVGEDRPYAIATDQLFVYYTLAGGGVHKVKKTGGSFPVSLTSAPASSGGGSTPMGDDGGANNQDAGASDPDAGSTDDAGANATDGGSSGVDAGAGGNGDGGGSPQGSVQAAYGIALSSDNVYYTTNEGVHRVSKLGGDDVLFVPDSAGADAIVADDTAIYWMDHGGGSGAGAIKRADLATGAVTTLADGLGFDGLGTFALAGDADYLYFPEPKKNRLYRISKTDGTPSALATSVLNPTAIALDDSNVYIASQGSVYNNGTSYTIQSVSKTGSGNPLTLVSQTINSDVAGLVVDAQYVWFSTRADGEVDRVSKYGGSYGYPATSGSGSPYSQ